MPRVHIPSLPWDELHSPRRTFHSFCRNVSLAQGGIRNGGTWCGGHPFDVQIRRVPAGAAVCPFHSHATQWELFVVLSGVATVRVGAEMHTARAGEVFIHPPGEAHRLDNRSDADLEVLIVADNPPFDAFYYPDSTKWGLRPPGIYFRPTATDYFDGEEAPPEDVPRPLYIPSGSPAASPLTPFAQRKLHPDSLPWTEWNSPRGKFHGASKELSIALGAKRNAPAGLGGHPFELELMKLAPGECGCPFHSHAAQWEMFLILEGRASVRAGPDTHTLAAGDVVLHPPGEPHRIDNAGAADLLFYLIADNPPVDSCHYPDSDKTSLGSPEKFFRLHEVDLWDGEE